MKAMDKEVDREDEDGGGVGRGAKLGLVAIALLAIVFVGLLVMKLSGPDEKAVASDANRQKPSAKSPKVNAGPTWGQHKRRDSSPKKPIVVAPSKQEKTRSSKAARSNPWSTGSAETSPALSMMPDQTTGSSSAGYASVAPAPQPESDRGTWSHQTAQSGQASSPGVPPDPFTQQAPQPTTSSSYPAYYPPSNQYGSSDTSYAPYPSYPSSASSEPNPMRGSAGNGSYQSAYTPYGANSQGTGQYSPGNHGSSRNDSRRDHGYEQAPYSPKAARPYPMGRRDTRSFDATSSYDRDSSYSSGNPYSSRSTTISGLGVRREDGKYVVGPNESFAAISQRLYGTDAYFKALSECNRTAFPDPDQLRVGDLIDAPDERELLDKYPDLCPSPQRRDVMQSRISSVSAGPRYRGGPTYTVQEGDTLFDIARYKLGNGARWPEIYDLNSDVLKGDFNYVTPGMTLTLPEESADAVTQRPGADRAY